MKAWIVTMPGELLPWVDKGQRMLRMGLLLERLLHNGHEVTWWSSTFDHINKRLRFGADQHLRPQEGFDVRLLHAGGYPQNVCWARMRHNARLRKLFCKAATMVDRPSVIYAALPAPEICLAAVEYGASQGVPVVVDVRDLWPDAISELFPWPARWAVRMGLWPMRRQVRRACSGATALTAMSEGCLQWGLDQARRFRRDTDRVFHLAYPEQVIESAAEKEACRYWDHLGVDGDNRRIICFMGTHGVSVRLMEVFECARRCISKYPDFLFVIGGDGSQKRSLESKAKDCPNVIWSGWLDQPKIQTLLHRAWAGLVPYVSSYNLERGMPNKVGEYLSASLPILSSLRGSVAELLSQHEVGLTYREGDAGDLMAMLDRLATNPSLYGAMASNGRRLFWEQFDAGTIYGEFAELLESLGTAGGARP